jgi:alkyldihydroxyacetonephosphate synthase
VTDVKHMKWWGWGVEGVAFEHEDKPGFAPFILENLALDLHTAQVVSMPDFDGVTVAKSLATPEFTKSLSDVVGLSNVTSSNMERVVHAYGKSMRDLVRIRANQIERTPDVVVYPDNEDEIQKIVDIAVAANAVIIPFGGGSNIGGSLEPLRTEKRVVISLDMGRMNRVIEIDADAGLARIQAGALGPDLEEQLGAKGWTIGHFPDSFTHSTLGGWIATRSSGMQSDKYGDIADITRGLRLVRPGGTVIIRPIPSASNGPSVREMILGSEGRLGIVTEAWVQVHRVPEKRDVYAYFFPNFETGLKAMQEISESDATPSITRISDNMETRFSLATSKASHGVTKFVSGTVLPAIFRSKGWNLDDICLSFIGYEGSERHATLQKRLVDKIVKKYNGMGVGKGPGILYDQKKFDTPYIRDFLLDRGAAGDVSESAAPWSKLQGLHDGVVKAAHDAFATIGRQGVIISHLSHSYHSGACLYFTFGFVFGKDALHDYDIVKSAIQQAFIDNGGSISHHHGVGLEHAPWLEDDISSAGMGIMQGLFDAVDPEGNFNPGKIIAAGGLDQGNSASALHRTPVSVKKAPVAKAPVAQAPVAAATVKAPVPAARTTATKTTVTKIPVATAPAAVKPVPAKTTASKTPAAKAPAAKAPATKAPATKAPVAKKPAAKTPPKAAAPTVVTPPATTAATPKSRVGASK